MDKSGGYFNACKVLVPFNRIFQNLNEKQNLHKTEPFKEHRLNGASDSTRLSREVWPRMMTPKDCGRRAKNCLESQARFRWKILESANVS